MDTERAGKILEAHGLTKKAFADMIGLKASTARMAFSTKRFSKKMVAKLEELERESSDLAEVDEMLESVREPSVLEGMVRECTDNPLEREGKIYAVPRNKFLLSWRSWNVRVVTWRKWMRCWRVYVNQVCLRVWYGNARIIHWSVRVRYMRFRGISFCG